MNRIRQSIGKLLLGSVMALSLFAGISTVSAATGPAPSDWAFEESSRELNDAIVEAYPTLSDANGYVTITSANAMTGAINVQGKTISGTMNGIENFVQINHLDLRNNNLTGEIPQNISNITNLSFFNLANNNLEGNIPSVIGNLTGLQTFVLYGNNFNGSIPSQLGDLINLTTLDLSLNDLTGSIPSSLGSLVNLQNLEMHSNNLSGEVPLSVFALPNLIKVQLQGNTDLTGNPAVGFASSTTLTYLDVTGTDLIQASPNNPTLAIFKGENLASNLLTTDKTNLNGDITQTDIDKAQESADFITDPTVKQQWQDDIDLAQRMLNAKNKVNELLTSPDLANLNHGITMDDVNDAQNLVSALPSGTLKDELQAKIDIAKNLLNAEEKVGNLFNPDGTLANNVDQNKINDAQNAVNALPDGLTKDVLQALIDLAQNMFNESVKEVELSKPSEIVTVTKEGSRIVNTNDENNMLLLGGLLVSSLAAIAILKRRKFNN